MEDRLQKFAHLVDAGSFTKAAQDMHISQPALSMAIQKLERELRTALYVRGSQPLALTQAGTQAYRSAKELHVSLRNLRTSLSELAKQEVEISLGMIDSVADILLANTTVVHALEQQARVSLVINNSRYLLQALARGDIDVAIIVEQPQPLDQTFHAERLGAEPLHVSVHKHHAHIVQKEIEQGSLRSFISYDQPSHTNAMVGQFFIAKGVYVSPRFFSSSPDVIYRLLMAKKGAAALPYRKVRPHLKTGTLVPACKDAVIPRRISLVTRRNYRLPQLLATATAGLQVDLARLLTEAHKR